MALVVNVQLAVEFDGLPASEKIRSWLGAGPAPDGSELTLRIVDNAECAELNQQYRNKTGPTNILSFPFESPPGFEETESHYLGDLVLAADVVNDEAKEQAKSRDAHWAHILLHGLLHLLGYDHQTDAEAREMEALEIQLLAKLDYPDPYQSN